MIGRRCFFCSITSLLLALPAATAWADGLLWQLPADDGTWADYNLDCTANASGVQRTVTGTLRLASVGHAVVAGQPCRWIEVELNVAAVVEGKEVKNERVCKLLIPEKWLQARQSPLDHVVSAWWQPESGGGVKKLDDARTIDTPLPVILSGPWKGVTSLKKTEIECGVGTLSCEGKEGKLDFPLKGGGTMKCKLESWLNPDSPFGAVSSHWLLETPAGKMAWNLKLAKYGQKAESKLPDAK